jgi:hypothetical protein
VVVPVRRVLWSDMGVWGWWASPCRGAIGSVSGEGCSAVLASAWPAIALRAARALVYRGLTTRLAESPGYSYCGGLTTSSLDPKVRVRAGFPRVRCALGSADATEVDAGGLEVAGRAVDVLIQDVDGFGIARSSWAASVRTDDVAA